MSNTIQKAVQNKEADNKKTLQEYIKVMAPEIKKALPSVMTPERFTRMTLSAISSNAKLAKCTPQSFLGSMMTAAQLGLELNTPLGQAYIIPYKRKKKQEDGTWTEVYEAQFQLGYKGLIDLAYRSGDVEIIQANIVYENDTFEMEYGLNPKLRHIPAKGDRGNPVQAYAIFKTRSGGYGFEADTIENIRNFAMARSKTYNEGPWQTDFEEMCKKTVLKRALKYAPMKTEFVKAVVQDESVKTEISEDMYEVTNEAEDNGIEVISVTTEEGEAL